MHGHFTGRPEDFRQQVSLCPFLQGTMPSVLPPAGATLPAVPEIPPTQQKENTMSMVVPPDFKGVVVDSDDKDGRGRGNCGSNESCGLSTKDSIAAALNTTLNALSENTIQTVGLLKDASTDMTAIAGHLGEAVQAAGAASTLATSNSQAVVSGQLSDKTATVLTSIGARSEHLSDKICEGFREVTGRMSDSRVEVLTAITNGSAATQNVLRDGFAAAALAAQREAATIQASICAAASAAALASATNTATILAKQNDSDAKMAACCCALTAETIRQATAARELALLIEGRTVSAALVTMAAENAALKTQAAITAAIAADRNCRPYWGNSCGNGNGNGNGNGGGNGHNS